MNNRVTELFGIETPLIQAGMVWCSGWELASAVSNAGGLGIIGAGSMYPEILKEQIQKCKKATNKPFAVNLPLLYPSIEAHVQIIIEEKVPVVFTSAGSPKKWTPLFKEHGIKVVHVVSNVIFAQKSEAAGVDAVVAEGFEAGGHNGREETTTMCLIPLIVDAVKIPVIAAGGIGSGKSMAAAFALGAEGVQIGSRFVATPESSAHLNFKNAVVDAKEGATELTLKELTPVRLMKNKFYKDIQAAYDEKASPEELKELLGRARAKKGMFEGDLNEGELEIGQISSTINEIKPAEDIVKEIMAEFHQTISKLQRL
ncbi:MAG: nitronate monooxygenase [Flavobacteriales bacterium]|nr:nitronate monooxygenase [Flavobacteriales bacterium]